jgi:hypothetical protein
VQRAYAEIKTVEDRVSPEQNADQDEPNKVKIKMGKIEHAFS